jgi:hypothetical protein
MSAAKIYKKCLHFMRGQKIVPSTIDRHRQKFSGNLILWNIEPWGKMER